MKENTTELARRIIALIHFVNADINRLDEEGITLLSHIFNDGKELSKEELKRLREMIIQVRKYEEFNGRIRTENSYRYFAEMFCENDSCKFKQVISGTIPENEIYNLVVGPRGHFQSGDSNAYIEQIKKLLGSVGKDVKYYFHDPYLESHFHENRNNFPQQFVALLESEFTGITLVAQSMKYKGNETSSIKRIESDLHDRFFLAEEKGQWKGVLIGGSINSYPNPTHSPQPHFLMASLQKEDAEMVGKILLDSLSK